VQVCLPVRDNTQLLSFDVTSVNQNKAMQEQEYAHIIQQQSIQEWFT